MVVPKQSASVYCATKSAIHSFSKSLRWQLETTPIKVFEIIPPLVDTEMTAGRSRGKIAPETLVEKFWRHLEQDRYEVKVGLVKPLLFLNRLMPKQVESMMRGGL